MKKIIIFLASVLMMVVIMPSSVEAGTNNRWVKKGDNVWTMNDGAGNDLKAEYENGKLTISGKGEIPDYTELFRRPWDKGYITELSIGSGITSIGNKAFANLNDLYKIEMYISTFIEDIDAFRGASDYAIFTIKGMNFVNRGTEKVPYTSLDNISHFVDSHANDYRFIFDNYYVVNMIKSGHGSKEYKGVYPADVFSQATNPNYPCVDLTSKVICDEGYGKRANLSYCYPGPVCRQVFEAFLLDYNYLASYNLVASQYLKTVTKWDTPMAYSFTIPSAYRLPGRQFRVLQILPGAVNILDDIDTSDDTVSFVTDYPTTTYAIVYK